MNGYSDNQVFLASSEAAALIESGHAPDELVHILHWPHDSDQWDDSIVGLSSPITPAEYSRADYTERYYSLRYLASLGQ